MVLICFDYVCRDQRLFVLFMWLVQKFHMMCVVGCCSDRFPFSVLLLLLIRTVGQHC